MSFIRSSIAAVALFPMESLLNVLLRIRILAQGLSTHFTALLPRRISIGRSFSPHSPSGRQTAGSF
jgi:hypothetical protein